MGVYYRGIGGWVYGLGLRVWGFGLMPLRFRVEDADACYCFFGVFFRRLCLEGFCHVSWGVVLYITLELRVKIAYKGLQSLPGAFRGEGFGVRSWDVTESLALHV